MALEALVLQKKEMDTFYKGYFCKGSIFWKKLPRGVRVQWPWLLCLYMKTVDCIYLFFPFTVTLCRMDENHSAETEPKFLVFYSMLLSLFSMFCFKCKANLPSVHQTCRQCMLSRMEPWSHWHKIVLSVVMEHSYGGHSPWYVGNTLPETLCSALELWWQVLQLARFSLCSSTSEYLYVISGHFSCTRRNSSCLPFWSIGSPIDKDS